MYYPCLVHEIQCIHNNEQEPLQESFVKCSPIEQIS